MEKIEIEIYPLSFNPISIILHTNSIFPYIDTLSKKLMCKVILFALLHVYCQIVVCLIKLIKNATNK